MVVFNDSFNRNLFVHNWRHWTLAWFELSLTVAARDPTAPEDKDIVILEEAFNTFGSGTVCFQVTY